MTRSETPVSLESSSANARFCNPRRGLQPMQGGLRMGRRASTQHETGRAGSPVHDLHARPMRSARLRPRSMTIVASSNP